MAPTAKLYDPNDLSGKSFEQFGDGTIGATGTNEQIAALTGGTAPPTPAVIPPKPAVPEGQIALWNSSTGSWDIADIEFWNKNGFKYPQFSESPAQAIEQEAQWNASPPEVKAATVDPLTSDAIGENDPTLAAYIGSLTGSGATPEQQRALAMQYQFPSQVWNRIGLEGGLAQNAEGQGVSTQGLSQLLQAGLQNQFRQQIAPGYAMQLAAQAGNPTSAATPQTFEEFARQQLGQGGQGMQNLPTAWDSGQFINTIQDVNNVSDPYRNSLIEYLGGADRLVGTQGSQNQDYLRLLNSEALSKIAPIYRNQAAQQMMTGLQNRMTMNPEKALLDFYTGRPNPNNLNANAFQQNPTTSFANFANANFPQPPI